MDKFGPTKVDSLFVLVFTLKLGGFHLKAVFTRPIRLFLVSVVWFCSPALASIAVPAGSSLSLPSGASIDLACGNVSVSGILGLGNATLTGVKDFSVNTGGFLSATNSSLSIAGNFTGDGPVSAASSSLTVTDGCSANSSQLSGKLQFQNLILQSSVGKPFTLAANTTLTITGTLRLIGTPGQPVILNGLSGARIILMPGSNVVTVDAIISAPIEHGTPTIVAVPTMSSLGLLLMVISLLSSAIFTYRNIQPSVKNDS